MVVIPLRRQVHVLHGQNTDSNSWAKFTLPKEAEGAVEQARWRKELLLPTMREARVVKSAAEIDVLRYVARISSQGHVRVMQSVKPGMAEWQLEATFQVTCRQPTSHPRHSMRWHLVAAAAAVRFCYLGPRKQLTWHSRACTLTAAGHCVPTALLLLLRRVSQHVVPVQLQHRPQLRRVALRRRQRAQHARLQEHGHGGAPPATSPSISPHPLSFVVTRAHGFCRAFGSLLP